MARGHPDWGIDVDSASLFGIDNAELAARLGSLDVVTRGGKVIYQDDFNRPALSWINGGSDVGCYSWLSLISSYIGGQHLRLTTDTAPGSWVYAARYFPYYLSFYNSVSFYFTIFNHPLSTVFTITVQNGVLKRTFEINLHNSPYELQYLNSLGNYTTIQNLYDLESGGASIWHFMRIMFDPINGEYISFIINGTEIDISGIQAYDVGGTNAQSISFRAWLFGDGVQEGIIGIDGMICKTEDYIMYQ